jgi:hypothetical protein
LDYAKILVRSPFNMAVNVDDGAAYKSFNSWRLRSASMFSDEDLDVRKVICTTGLPQRVLS